jgi:hypothetical protein
MGELYAAIVSAVIGAAIAIVTVLITTRSQIKREREKTRIQYLDPLVVAADDLLAKISSLIAALDNKEDWINGFLKIKDWDRNNPDKRKDFALWCNGEGAGAVTALYLTCVYFARARKIRAELPFIQLGPHDDQALLDRLTKVREAFGGEFNIWVELQDSIGEYVTEANGKIMGYRGFCTQLIDGWEHIWFLRLIDFFRDIHMKREIELPRIVSALKDLIAFAKKASTPQPKLGAMFGRKS